MVGRIEPPRELDASPRRLPSCYTEVFQEAGEYAQI